MNRELQRLGDRLDVIETALSVALGEPEPEHRGRMLDALSAATEAARAEHHEAETIKRKRSALHVVRGSIPQQPHPVDTPTAAGAEAARSPSRSPGRARSSAE